MANRHEITVLREQIHYVVALSGLSISIGVANILFYLKFRHFDANIFLKIKHPKMKSQLVHFCFI